MIFGPIKLIVSIISTILSFVVLYFAVTFVQIWLTGHEHATGSAQAILVFGTTEDNGVPSPELTARLDDALTLYRAHRAPWVVVTGGRAPGDVYTEAGVSATYLARHGVPMARIIVGGGADTWQNVTSVIGQMRARHLVTVLSVTDPFHEYRAMAIASSEGLKPTPVPVADSPTVKHSLWRYYLKETLAAGVGRIVGYGRLSSWTTGATSVLHGRVP
ncbi:MAG: YdcF family protein [Acidobacteriota bacterium]|nr:YdcF family protein [Acidobacteriota bacterium]